MKNSDNKEQLVRVMLNVWSQDKMAKKIVGRKIILVCGNKAYLLSSADGHNRHYRGYYIRIQSGRNRHSSDYLLLVCKGERIQ